MAVPRSYPVERVRSGFTGELTSGTAAATRGSRCVAIVAIALLAVVSTPSGGGSCQAVTRTG